MDKLKFTGSVEVIVSAFVSTLAYILFFGVLVNFALWAVFGLPFTILTFLGYGIFAELLLVEVPEALSKTH